MKGDALYVLHILERLGRIEEYAVEGEQYFLSDMRTQDAVIRRFEIIGEAAKRISPQTRAGAPDVPWKLLAGFRDVLIHNYNGVRLGLVWDAVERDVPVLREPLQALFERLREAEPQ